MSNDSKVNSTGEDVRSDDQSDFNLLVASLHDLKVGSMPSDRGVSRSDDWNSYHDSENEALAKIFQSNISVRKSANSSEENSEVFNYQIITSFVLIHSVLILSDFST
jgi:hypothetical protein